MISTTSTIIDEFACDIDIDIDVNIDIDIDIDENLIYIPRELLLPSLPCLSKGKQHKRPSKVERAEGVHEEY